MRLHGVHSFNAFPMVVRSGGVLNAFGPKAGQKVIHPDTGYGTLACEGFNKKNLYDREIPCDQDFLRKMAKDTDANALLRLVVPKNPPQSPFTTMPPTPRQKHAATMSKSKPYIPINPALMQMQVTIVSELQNIF